MNEIQLQQHRVQYTIRRSKRARRVRITLKPDHTVVVTVPRAARVDVRDILMHHADWIIKKIKTMPALTKRLWQNHETLMYLGVEYTLRVELTSRSKSRLTFTQDHFTLSSHLEPTHPDYIQAASEAALQWFRAAAKEYIVPLAHEYAVQMNLAVNKIRIKNQKTLWGSASSKSNLNFNCRLMMAPEQIIRYVVIHELCHFTHMNHSKAFWALVEQYDPAYRQHRSWLRQHGASMAL